MNGPVSRTIAKRRMVRAFQPDIVDPAQLNELLDKARRAPSAGNTQAVRLLVLDTPELTDRYWNISLAPERRQTFRWQGLLKAPVLVVVVTEPERYPRRYREADKVASDRGELDRWPVPYWWVDAGMVAQNLLLLAVESGLGACLFGPFDHEPALRTEFDLGDEFRLVATIALGHPADDEPGRSANRERRPFDEVVIRPGHPQGH